MATDLKNLTSEDLMQELALRKIIRSLFDAIIEVGGTAYSRERLQGITALELFQDLARNGVSVNFRRI